MKFKLDENLSPSAAEVFIGSGFEFSSVKDEGLTGCSDDQLISICTIDNKVLVTLDLDFSDIRRYEPARLNGIIVIRTGNQSKNSIAVILKKFIPLLKSENVAGKLVIVEEDKIRIR